MAHQNPTTFAPALANETTRVTQRVLKTALFLPPHLPSPDEVPAVREDGRKAATNESLTAIVADACQVAGFRSALLNKQNPVKSFHRLPMVVTDSDPTDLKSFTQTLNGEDQKSLPYPNPKTLPAHLGSMCTTAGSTTVGSFHYQRQAS